MKRYFCFFVGLFFGMFVISYCFADSSSEAQYAKGGDGRHHHTLTRKLSEDPKFSGKLEKGIRVIEVKASKYKFDPDPIVVKLNEKVRLVVASIDVAHGLAISEFKVNLPVPAGKTETIEFVADKEGTFHVYCSVYCGQGHAQMKGSFIIK